MDVNRGRYAGIGTDRIEDETGAYAIYLRRRFLPSGSDIDGSRTFDAAHMPERLDLVAALALGDAFSFWRICDANDAMNPFDVVAESEGGRLRIPSELVQ
jgi:hypothetical protein